MGSTGKSEKNNNGTFYITDDGKLVVTHYNGETIEYERKIEVL